MAIHLQSSSTIEPEIDNTTTPLFETTTTAIPPTRRHLIRRRNPILNILTSDDHKIRQFPLDRTHGILIHCNEIRRRQLRELIFRSTPRTTRNINSSSGILHYPIFSLTLFINSLLFLQK